MFKKSLFAFAVAALMLSSHVFAEEKAAKKEDNEVKVEIKDLPEAVVKAVKAAQPGGTLDKADKETKKDGSVVYAVDVTNGGKKFEVEVDSTGKLISNKEEKDEKDEKKDEVKK